VVDANWNNNSDFDYMGAEITPVGWHIGRGRGNGITIPGTSPGAFGSFSPAPTWDSNKIYQLIVSVTDVGTTLTVKIVVRNETDNATILAEQTSGTFSSGFGTYLNVNSSLWGIGVGGYNGTSAAGIEVVSLEAESLDDDIIPGAFLTTRVRRGYAGRSLKFKQRIGLAWGGANMTPRALVYSGLPVGVSASFDKATYDPAVDTVAEVTLTATDAAAETGTTNATLQLDATPTSAKTIGIAGARNLLSPSLPGNTANFNKKGSSTIGGASTQINTTIAARFSTWSSTPGPNIGIAGETTLGWKSAYQHQSIQNDILVC
jgi:hypothetical protein